MAPPFVTRQIPLNKTISLLILQINSSYKQHPDYCKIKNPCSLALIIAFQNISHPPKQKKICKLREKKKIFLSPNEKKCIVLDDGQSNINLQAGIVSRYGTDRGQKERRVGLVRAVIRYALVLLFGWSGTVAGRSQGRWGAVSRWPRCRCVVVHRVRYLGYLVQAHNRSHRWRWVVVRLDAVVVLGLDPRLLAQQPVGRHHAFALEIWKTFFWMEFWRRRRKKWDFWYWSGCESLDFPSLLGGGRKNFTSLWVVEKNNLYIEYETP